MQGRSYRAYSGQLSKRQLNREVGRADEVIDHVVQSGGVRLLMASAESAVPELKDIKISPVEASVEDAFVARLIEERQSQNEESTESSSEKSSPVRPEKKHEAQNGGESVIYARNLGRSFGDFQAVRDVDLDIKRGEIFGLIGANGAGKTTTFRMLCGLLPASSGEIAVAGHDVRKVAATARANIGYMSQKFALYTNLSVRENLTFFAHVYGLSGKRHRQQMQQALEDFGLNEVLDMPSGDLPLGMKQRLALAAALMHSPKILFLDEPTSGVDPLTRRSFWAHINQLAESNVTIMVTTHFLEEAEYCDRLAIMAEGKIIATDTPEAIRARAQGVDETIPDMEEAFIRLIQKKAEAASESQ
ncbi:MAG: ATP-binding cassette domain-containing protein [Gammaproteobacteria bacterium]|nr:ATP-binding cassette domain-containing protein [Gammaproteobacteria bacterium]